MVKHNDQPDFTERELAKILEEVKKEGTTEKRYDDVDELISDLYEEFGD